MKLSEKSTIFHHHSTANINSLPFLQHPAPSQAMSLCERFGSKQRPLEPKQMNALKVLRPIRDARREGLDGTGWAFCLIHEPHWIFGCLNPDLWNWTKIQSIQYWWNMWTKSDLVGGKERGKPCVQFSRRLMGYIMESLAGTHRVERFVGPESGWAGRTQGKWPWFGGSSFFSWTSDYCDLSILSGSS